jgi:hypothetical protein
MFPSKRRKSRAVCCFCSEERAIWGDDGRQKMLTINDSRSEVRKTVVILPSIPG